MIPDRTRRSYVQKQACQFESVKMGYSVGGASGVGGNDVCRRKRLASPQPFSRLLALDSIIRELGGLTAASGL